MLVISNCPLAHGWEGHSGVDR